MSSGWKSHWAGRGLEMQGRTTGYMVTRFGCENSLNIPLRKKEKKKPNPNKNVI